jgi:hypothetical protein
LEQQPTVFGRYARMIGWSQSNSKADASFGWKFEKTFFMIFVSTLIGALLGSILWLLLPGPSLDWSTLWSAAAFGAFFGGWVGLIAYLLFGCVRRLREFGTRSALRMILTFIFLGGIAGAPVFFPFGDGLAMALGLAIEAAVFGGLIGAVLGAFLFLVIFRRRKELASNE